jgi:hypothetical protein
VDVASQPRLAVVVPARDLTTVIDEKWEPAYTENAMLQMLKALLRKLRLYDAMRRSPVHGVYLRLFYPELASRPRRELAFYRQALPTLRPGDLIFDVGANNGFKTDIFLRLGARVVCVEPDQASV